MGRASHMDCAAQVVVKNTFFSLLDAPSVEEKLETPRPRSSSDSALFEISFDLLSQWKSDELDVEKVSSSPQPSITASTVEYDMSGLSDMDRLSQSGPSSSSSSSQSEQEETAELEDMAHVREVLNEWKSSGSCLEIADVVNDNSQRVEQCSPIEGAACNGSFANQQMGAGQVCWVPVAFTMPVCSFPADAAWPAKPSRAVNKKQSQKSFRFSGEQITFDSLGDRTTVMLQNLPNNYSSSTLLATIDAEGFAGLYDFFYLPMDFKSNACLGYAFINFVDPLYVGAFWSKFHGYSNWIIPSRKVASVTWSGPHQGLQAHVDRYRDSPVMHSSVPEDYKPMMFKAGARVAFPVPSKMPKAPRIRSKPQPSGSSAKKPGRWVKH